MTCSCRPFFYLHFFSMSFSIVSIYTEAWTLQATPSGEDGATLDQLGHLRGSHISPYILPAHNKPPNCIVQPGGGWWLLIYTHIVCKHAAFWIPIFSSSRFLIGVTVSSSLVLWNSLPDQKATLAVILYGPSDPTTKKPQNLKIQVLSQGTTKSYAPC